MNLPTDALVDVADIRRWPPVAFAKATQSLTSSPQSAVLPDTARSDFLSSSCPSWAHRQTLFMSVSINRLTGCPEEAFGEVGHGGVFCAGHLDLLLFLCRRFAYCHLLGRLIPFEDVSGRPQPPHFPMQNRLKITPSSSSALTAPVIWPSAWWARRSSSANRSRLASPWAMWARALSRWRMACCRAWR